MRGGKLVRAEGEREPRAKKLFGTHFLAPLLRDKKTGELPVFLITGRYKVEVLSGNAPNLGVAALVAKLFFVAESRDRWKEQTNELVTALWNLRGKIGPLRKTLEREVALMNYTEDAMLEARELVFRMADPREGPAVPKEQIAAVQSRFREMVAGFGSIVGKPLSYRGVSTFYAERLGKLHHEIILSSAWRYRTNKHMFKDASKFNTNALELDIASMHFFRTKPISIYDFLYTLTLFDLLRWVTNLTGVDVPSRITEVRLPWSTKITTVNGNVFITGKEVGHGSNAVVYKAKTVERVRGMEYIPDTVVIKVGNKKQFHEQMMYESIEEYRRLNPDQDFATVRYYDHAYIAGIHMMVLEYIDGTSDRRYAELITSMQGEIDNAVHFVNLASGLDLQDYTGPGNVMVGTRTDTRNAEFGVYLIDLDPFGQV